MYTDLMRIIFCTSLCLWTGSLAAAATSDPFGTEAIQPLKPALRLDGAVGDPCGAQPLNRALNLLDVVNLALCNNPKTREAWANARVQAAQVGVSKAGYLPGEAAGQLLAAAGATQDSTVQTLFLAAVQAYYQEQAAIAALDAALESERAARASFAAAEARYAAGSATPADKLQARTAYSPATLNRITAEGNLKNAQGALADFRLV